MKRGDVIVVAGIFVRFLRYGLDGCAECAQELDFFRSLRFRNDDVAPVPFGVTDDGQTNSSVAGGAFDDGAAGFQPTICLGVGDDAECGAVFHRTTGIHEFRFAKNFAAGEFAQPAQTNQRRVADVIINSVILAHLPRKIARQTNLVQFGFIYGRKALSKTNRLFYPAGRLREKSAVIHKIRPRNIGWYSMVATGNKATGVDSWF